MSVTCKEPKLRFKEFSGEWEDNKLKTFSLIYDGTHQTPKYTNTGIPFVSVENIDNIKSTEKYISQEDFDKYKIKPKQNDILMTRITAGIIGATAIVENDNPLAYYVSLALIRIKENQNINVPFLSQYISSIYFKKELHKRIIHTAFPKKINLGDIGECHSFLPSKQEQEKIASFLTSVDTKIEQLSLKVELLKEYKKGVMQKIFCGELRFKREDGSEFPEWEEKKLRDITKIIVGGTPSTTKNEYWENGTVPWLSSGDINNGNINKASKLITDLGLQKSSAKLMPKTTVLLAMTGATLDLNIETSGNQSVAGMLPNDNFCSKFLFYSLQKNINLIFSMAGGAAQAGINKATIESLSFSFPCLEEQTKIANFLSSIDTKIEQVQKQLDSTKEFKKALLQQMFV